MYGLEVSKEVDSSGFPTGLELKIVNDSKLVSQVMILIANEEKERTVTMI